MPLLVVDDDPSVLDALRFTFQLEGYDVRTYRDGESLLDDPDLPAEACLILDQKLPGISGLDLLRDLRARGMQYTGVLITTPTPFVQRQAEAADLPIVEKPLISGILLDAIQRLNPGLGAG